MRYMKGILLLLSSSSVKIQPFRPGSVGSALPLNREFSRAKTARAAHLGIGVQALQASGGSSVPVATRPKGTDWPARCGSFAPCRAR